MDERKDTPDDSAGVPEAERPAPDAKLYYWHAETQEYTDRDGDECTSVAVVSQGDYMKLIAALAAVCERGDTDHSAKSMYWIASDALRKAGFNSQGSAQQREAK